LKSLRGRLTDGQPVPLAPGQPPLRRPVGIINPCLIVG
jgi:hypothetical protein